MKAQDAIKLLEKNGWLFQRQTGSHKIFKHPANPNQVSVPDHGKKDLPIGTLRQILRKAGI